jgi:hypothetical protein
MTTTDRGTERPTAVVTAAYNRRTGESRRAVGAPPVRLDNGGGCRVQVVGTTEERSPSCAGSGPEQGGLR